MKLISGTSNLPFAQQLADKLNLACGAVELSSFRNGERRVRISEDVVGEEVIVVQSFSDPVDTNIMEFLLITDALERMGVKRVYAVIPWLGYSLQDKSFRAGEPIAAKVVANLVSSSFVHRVYLLDLHNSSIPGFFSVPTVHTTATDLFIDHVKTHFPLENTVIASPDFGGLKRARTFADALELPLVNIDKDRDLHTGKVTSVELHGDVKGKVVLLYDDIILSGGTAAKTAQLLKEQGAAQTHFLATHGLFVGDAVEKLNASALDSIIITNTVAHQQTPQNTQQLDCTAILSAHLQKWL